MTDRIVFVFTLTLAAVYFYATAQIHTYEFGDPLGPKTFPRLLGIGLLVTAAMLFVEMWRARKAQSGKEPQNPGSDRRHFFVVGAVVIWTAVYFALFTTTGYMLGTAVYLVALMWYFNAGKPVANVATAVLYSVISYLAFTKALGVALPRGFLPF